MNAKPLLCLLALLTALPAFAGNADSLLQAGTPLYQLPGVVPPKYITPLKDLFQDAPTDDIADFSRGYLYLAYGRPDSALIRFDSAVVKTKLLKSYAHYFRLLSLTQLNRKKEAVIAYGTLTALDPNSPAARKGLVLLLRSNLLGSTGEALRFAERALPGTGNPELLYLAGQLYLRNGETENALRQWLAVLKKRSYTDYSDSAYRMCRETMAKSAGPDDDKILTLCQYLEARLAFDSLWTLSSPRALKPGPNQEQFIRMAHISAFRLKRYGEALRMNFVLEKATGRSAYSLYRYALCLERMKFYSASFLLYRKYLNICPDGDMSDNILWDAARRYEDKRDFAKAARTFTRIYTQCPKAAYADKACFRAGYSYYKNGAYDSSIILFNECARLYPDKPISEGCPYWIAKSLVKAGKPDSAAAWFLKTLEQSRFTFHAFRAQEQLKALNQDSLLTHCPQPEPWSLETLLDTLERRKPERRDARLPFYERAVLLFKCGILDMAVEELKNAAESADHDLRFQFRVVRIYETYGFFTEAYRLSRKLMLRIPESRYGHLPEEVLKSFFPRYFGEAVDMECRKYGVDPLFIQSIMRQESTYDYKIMSPAGAVGLLQLMPKTAAEAARGLQIAFAADSLFNPVYNIRTGVYHVVELLDRFDNSLESVLCAYNAGSSPAREWLRRGQGRDYDEYVEDIGYSETRNYVKKCMRNYWVYKRIWERN